MARKYEVTFQGSRGQSAKIRRVAGNVTTVKFANRRAKTRTAGNFPGAVCPTA